MVSTRSPQGLPPAQVGRDGSFSTIITHALCRGEPQRASRTLARTSATGSRFSGLRRLRALVEVLRVLLGLLSLADDPLLASTFGLSFTTHGASEPAPEQMSPVCLEDGGVVGAGSCHGAGRFVDAGHPAAARGAGFAWFEAIEVANVVLLRAGKDVGMLWRDGSSAWLRPCPTLDLTERSKNKRLDLIRPEPSAKAGRNPCSPQKSTALVI
jgi:hypothetical protein